MPQTTKPFKPCDGVKRCQADAYNTYIYNIIYIYICLYTCIIYIYTHIHTVPLCHHFPVRRLIFGPTCHKIVNNQADLVWIINPGDCTTLNFSWVVTNKKIIEPAKFQSLFKQRFAPGLRLPFGRLALRFFLQIVMVVIPMPHSPNERLAMSSCCEHLGNSVNPMPWAPLVRSGWLVLPLAWHLCCRHCFAATKPLKLGEGGGEWLHKNVAKKCKKMVHDSTKMPQYPIFFVFSSFLIFGEGFHHIRVVSGRPKKVICGTAWVSSGIQDDEMANNGVHAPFSDTPDHAFASAVRGNLW